MNAFGLGMAGGEEEEAKNGLLSGLDIHLSSSFLSAFLCRTDSFPQKPCLLLAFQPSFALLLLEKEREVRERK